MKQAIKIFGTITRLLFEAIFTYLMLVLLSVGFDKYLWIGVIVGLIGITFSMADLFDLLVWDKKEEKSYPLTDTLQRKKQKLYAKIEEEDELFYFEVYAQNHELICVSDAFATHDGAITGLWYLMDSMKQMDELSWDFR